MFGMPLFCNDRLLITGLAEKNTAAHNTGSAGRLTNSAIFPHTSVRAIALNIQMPLEEGVVTHSPKVGTSPKHFFCCSGKY